jgi:hypothetical protein
MINAASIIRLNFTAGPTAVVGRVWSFIVDAVYRQPFRLISHVGVKVLERVNPAVADGNAPATVMPKIFVIWIQATLLHRSPDIVDFRACHSVRSEFKPYFSHSASTGNGPAGFNITRSDSLSVTAVTLKKPDSDARTAWRYFGGKSFNCGQATKSLTCDIFETGHSNLLLRLLCLWREQSPYCSRFLFYPT